MALHPKNKSYGNGSHALPSLTFAELELNLLQEKQRNDSMKSEFELSKLVARQEIDRHKRECMFLKENVSRLEEDRNLLRAREAKDQERINSFLEKIENNKKEFTEKLAELKMKNWDLEFSLHALMEKYEALLQENSRLQEKMNAKENEEMSKRNDSGKKDSGISLIQSSNCISQTELGKIGAKEKSVVVEDAHIPSTPANNKRKTSNGSHRPEKRSKQSVSEPCQVARRSGSAKCNVLAKGVPAYCKRNIMNQSSDREYTGRFASSKQLTSAIKRAEKIQSNLSSGNPSFVKPMVRSNVCSCFWLSVPQKFAKVNLPTERWNMTLEDENGLEYESTCINNTRSSGLSGGWKDFAVDHDLEIGDALIFELTEPARFKVYIIKAIQGNKIALSQLWKRKNVDVDKKDLGTSLKQYSDCMTQSVGAKEKSAVVEDEQIPSTPANKKRKVLVKGVHSYRKRTNENQSNGLEYTRRFASPEQLACAIKKAEKIQSNLSSHNPSFIRPMVRSNVSCGFWLNIPQKFAKGNLPTDRLKMTLEDENGLEYESTCITNSGYPGLSGGWKGFVIDHELEIGDALIFELCEPARFKVYIIKAIQDNNSGQQDDS